MSNNRATSIINSETLLLQGDVNTQYIMMMIDKGIKKNLKSIPTEQGKKARSIFLKIRIFRILSILGLIVLTFIEKPRWCITMEYEKGNDPTCFHKEFPGSEIYYIDPIISKSIELVLIAILFGFMLLKNQYQKRSESSKRHQQIQYLITAISTVDIIVSFCVDAYPYPWFAALNRLIFLLILVRSVRETSKRFIYVMYSSIQMILFITIYVLFFGYLAMRIFEGTVEGVSYFSTYVDSIFNMLVLLTTTNYPDVMLPAYSSNRLMSLFFIIYLLLGLFLILNILMALFYNNYKTRYEKSLAKFHEQRNMYLENKFKELDQDNKGYLNKQETYEMFKQIHQLDSYGGPYSTPVKQEHFDHMFYLLDNMSESNVSGKITRDEFMKIFEVYELWKYEWSYSNFFDQGDSVSTSQRRKKTFKTKCKNFVTSIEYEYVTNIIVIFLFAEIAFRDRFYSYTNGAINIWFTIQITMNCLFFLTLVADWIVLGPLQSYSKHLRVLIETGAQLLNLYAIYILIDQSTGNIEEQWQQYTNKFEVVKIFEGVVIIRFLRLISYLFELKTFRIIVETLKGLLGPFWSLLTVLFSIFYVYALLGMILFGGSITIYTPEIRNNDTTPDLYALLNFNDFGSSYVTLFVLMVVNNWYVIAEMYVSIFGTQWVLIYFVTFYIWSVLIGLNIIVCFAIDMYAAIERLDKEKTMHEEKLYKIAQEVKSRKKLEVSENINLTEVEDGKDSKSTIYENDQYTVKRKTTNMDRASLRVESRINSSPRESGEHGRNIGEYFDFAQQNQPLINNKSS